MEENLETQTDNMNVSENSQTAPQQMDQNTANTTAAVNAPIDSEVYATFLQRFVAVLIDGVLIGLVSGMLGFVLNPLSGGEGSYLNYLGTLIATAYAVFMLSQYGATLGKMAMSIKVQNQVTGENLTPVEAFLREFVGKFISAFFLLGYLWMLWDSNKQTWHDKIAKSIVVKA